MGKISPKESQFSRVLDQGFRRCHQQPVFQARCMQPMSGRFADFVNSNFFKLLSAAVIMLNYFYIVYQTDFKMSHLGEEEPAAMLVIEFCFTVFYVCELSCQLLCFRKDFFFGADKLWNVFDMAIVFVSVFELVVTL